MSNNKPSVHNLKTVLMNIFKLQVILLTCTHYLHMLMQAL